MYAYYDPEADIAWLPTGKSDDVVSERVPDGLRDSDRTTHALVAIEVWDASTRLPQTLLEALPGLECPQRSSYTCLMQDSQQPDLLGLEVEAYQQGGYFNASQARAHAVSRQLLEHHFRRGRFERVRRGLYRVQGFPTAEHDDMREAWMAVGIADALLCNESALALLDLSDNIPDAVHLLVPRRRRGLRRPSGVIIHTRPDSEDIATVWRDGLPLTAPARTLLDVADRLQPEQLSMAVRQALRRGLLTTGQLQEEAERRHKQQAIKAMLSTEVSA